MHRSAVKWTSSLQTDVSFVSVQGEDGFPGFKGDMGIKGDRVSVVGLGFGPGTRVGLGTCM